MFTDFSWCTNFSFNLNIYLSHNLKAICMPQVPISHKQQLKLYQRRFDANKKATYHRQQKK